MKIQVNNTQSPLVPEGEYKLKVKDCKFEYIYSGKFTLSMQVVSQCKYNGTELKKSYNCNKKRPPGTKSKIYRDYVNLFGLPETPDEIDLGKFKGQTFIGCVKTVSRDSCKREIPQELQYSQVEELISLDTENNKSELEESHTLSEEFIDDQFVEGGKECDEFIEYPDIDFLNNNDCNGIYIVDKSTGELKFIPSDPENNSQ